MPPKLEPVVGRYLHLDIAGRAHRIYFEAAGSGVPLVCLHTAGADNRQWRHVLNDPEITDRFRVLAFDLPRHGKSYPTPGSYDDEYLLTADHYVEIIRAFVAAMELDRPALIGCSIGGRIVLELAARHAAEFRALIGVEAAAEQQPWYDTSWLNRPDVHGGEVCAALVSGLLAPQSPRQTADETLWQYKQSGPGVFAGDLHFYRTPSDLTERLSTIDTSVCPLYLLTGEYDFSCTPEDTARAAAAIPGVEAVTMREVGHFPMSENPEQFRKYLLPVLAGIAGATAAAEGVSGAG